MSDSDNVRSKRLAKLGKSNSNHLSHDRLDADVKTDRTTLKPKRQKSDSSETKMTVSNQNSAKDNQSHSRERADINVWVGHHLESILKATLSNDERKTRDYFALQTSLGEDEDLNIGTNLTYDLIDPALLEVLTEQGTSRFYRSPMDYLFDTWQKAGVEKRFIRSDDSLASEKMRVLNEVLRLSSSYASIMFQVPDMFANEVKTTDLIEVFWKNIDKYELFLIDIIDRAVENDTILELLNAVITPLTLKLQSLEYNGDIDYMKILSVIQLFLSNKAVASTFYKMDEFHPANLKGADFENKTLLGRILRISPLLPAMATANYSDLSSKPLIMKTHESIQAEYDILIARLFSICDRLVRSGKDSRSAFLKWLADVVNTNHLRRGEQADPKKIASDALMLNLTLILVKFSQPFLNFLNNKKINKIAMDYLDHNNKLLDLSEETKINATIEEYNNYYKKEQTVESPLNFISECFYLLLTYIHYGLGGLFISADRTSNIIKQLSQQLKKFDELVAQRNASMNNPMMKMLYNTKVKPLKLELQKCKAQKLSLQMFFLHRNMQLDVFEIIIGCITFFMKLIDPTHKYPDTRIKIPLHDYEDDTEKMEDVEYTRKLAPVPFRFYPEMFLEGIINYCHYISRFNNNPMFRNDAKLERLVEFAVLILRCPELVSNPHLKARLVEVLFFGSLPLRNGTDGYMISIFTDNKIVRENLMFCLLDFYVMVEKTGASSQFYDKFNSRYHISYILEKLWKFDYFKKSLKLISEEMPRVFIRLIARMLNDTTYLLDESLNHLHTIGACQREIEARSKGKPAEMPDSDKDLQTKLGESERMAKSFVQLSNKTVLLFDLFTQETPRSFVIVELVDRLAGMLDYNIVALVGPKYNELKVKNPEEYRFDPGELLFRLCSIFINLSMENEFVDAVARDERSFRPECFKKAINILYRVGKVPNQEFENKLLTFSKRAADKKAEEEEEESELGEIPDEFLDPLMFTLMKDPVKLPHSKVSIDRSVIKAHLMNDPTDPFNRTPLKIEDVKEDEELRSKIQAWIKKRKQAIRQEKAKKRLDEQPKENNSEDANGDVNMSV